MVDRNKLNLLIKELHSTTQNARYIRENFRRIKLAIEEILDGVVTTSNVTTIVNAATAISAFTVYEPQVCTSNGQTAFTLASTPKEDDKVSMSVNGLELTNGTHFTVSGTSVTFIPAQAGYELEINNELGFADKILFSYIVV